MQTIKIDPRDFIGSPFKPCPKCQNVEFGVLGIHNTTCTRRCRSCWVTLSEPLPALRKVVIYLDQFVVSNVMKLLDPSAKGHERVAADKFWRSLFEALDVVCQMQLAVCPDSKEHEHESLTSPFFQALKNTYEYFSGGVKFRNAEDIRRFQIAEVAHAWIRNEAPKFDFDAKQITYGGLHHWWDRFRVSVNTFKGDLIDELRKSREVARSGLAEVFEDWQKEKPTFEDCFAAERNAYGQYLLAGFIADTQKRHEAFAGLRPLDLEALLPSAHTVCVMNVIEVFKSAGVAEKDLMQTAVEFFGSGAASSAPFNIIAASMWASLALKAGAGQKEPPNQGTATDVDIVPTLLPYCDAIFIDNKARALLTDIPQRNKLPYPCRVFSLNNGDEFLTYLHGIRDSAPGDLVQTVVDVYGEGALLPNTKIHGVGIG